MSEPENSVAGIDYLCWIGTIAVPSSTWLLVIYNKKARSIEWALTLEQLDGTITVLLARKNDQVRARSTQWLESLERETCL
jgi:hypothetical protein